MSTEDKTIKNWRLGKWRLINHRKSIMPCSSQNMYYVANLLDALKDLEWTSYYITNSQLPHIGLGMRL
jgi:hypothetical protein